VETTADGHLAVHTASPLKLSGSFKLTAKSTDNNISVLADWKEVVHIRASPGASDDLFGQKSYAHTGTTFSGKVDMNVDRHWERLKNPGMCV
jgi:hypothetical protein